MELIVESIDLMSHYIKSLQNFRTPWSHHKSLGSKSDQKRHFFWSKATCDWIYITYIASWNNCRCLNTHDWPGSKRDQSDIFLIKSDTWLNILYSTYTSRLVDVSTWILVSDLTGVQQLLSMCCSDFNPNGDAMERIVSTANVLPWRLKNLLVFMFDAVKLLPNSCDWFRYVSSIECLVVASEKFKRGIYLVDFQTSYPIISPIGWPSV